MIKTKEFYGQMLVRNGDSSLTGQIYDILLKEIISGRWGIDERMPSFNSLFEMTNVSRYPLKTALNRLENEGYIEKIRQKGIFVRKTQPKGEVLGKIVIYADSGSFSPHHNGIPKFTEGFGLIDMVNLQKQAASRGYRLDISDKEHFNKIIDDEDVKGIISLLPIDDTIQSKNDLPIVYLGVEDPLCEPCITGDNYKITYELTKRLLNLGHENIAVFVPDFWTSKQVDISIEGHIRALQEAGVPFNSKSVEISRKLKYNTIKSAKEFLHNIPEATAILTLAVDSAVKIGEYADLADMKIPEDFSLVSLQAGYYSDFHDAIFSGYYDWKTIIKTCFDLIIDRKFNVNNNGFSRIIMSPIFDWGKNANSMAAPKKR